MLKQSRVNIFSKQDNNKINIIGTQFFRKWIISSEEKYWKPFSSRVFKKDRVIDKDGLPSWVNIIKKEFSNLRDDQINQISCTYLQKLLHSLGLYEFSNNFDYDLKFDYKIE